MITRRRAQEFHDLVESSSTGSAGVRQVDLLEIVDGLRGVPGAVPDPAFVVALRERLIAEAESVLAAAAADRDDTRPRSRPWPTVPNSRRRQRRLAAVVAGVALAGASTTMAVAAQSALPGEGLYPVKRGLENAHAQLTLDRADRGRVLLDNAGTRLDEAQELSREQADPTRVSDALDAFSEQAVDGSDLLVADYQATGDRSSMTTVRTFTVTSMDRLKLLQSQVPPQSFDSLLRAAQALEEMQRTSLEACSVCDGPLIGSVPGVLASATQAPVDAWRFAVPRPRHDRPRSESSGGPSVHDAKGHDRAPPQVTDPGSSTTDPGTSTPGVAATDPEQPTTGGVKHAVRQVTNGVIDNQQNDVPQTVSGTTDDLTGAVGDAVNDVPGTLDDTVGGTGTGTGTGTGSQLPTLP